MRTYAGIAISGKAGAGKTRFTHELMRELERRDYMTTRLAFADALKDEVERLYGVTKEDEGGRARLIQHGMSRRAERESYWVEVLAQEADHVRRMGRVPVVHDMRFRNEYDWARGDGMLLVRIDATPTDRLAALFSRGEDTTLVESAHPSETDLDEAVFDLRWWNPHGGLVQLTKLACLTADAFTGIVAYEPLA